MRRKRLAAGLIPLALTAGGCSPPQVSSPANQRLIAGLRTGISARNSEWLEQTVDVVEERRAVGEMGDEEYEAFKAIIDKAKAGQWEDAEQDTIAFLKAQRPAPEQIDHVTHGHAHTHD